MYIHVLAVTKSVAIQTILLVTTEKHSGHFVEKILSINTDESQLMVSFDVKSLFTFVPLQEALQVIEECLLQDETLGERTMMTTTSVCHLITLCLDSTYFKVGDEIFEQMEGVPMDHRFH